MMHAVARSSGGMSAASAIHINIFGPHPIVVFGNEEQRQRWLPDLVQGKVKTCFGVTEPDAGLNTSQIKTKAEKNGNGYVVNGKNFGPPPPKRPTKSCCWPAPPRARRSKSRPMG